MPTTSLDAILMATRNRVATLRPRARELERQAAASPPPRQFGRALVGSAVGVIAEVKRRSPSAGAIRDDLDSVRHAQAYERGGAAATPGLHDEAHIGSSVEILARVALADRGPLLGKDSVPHEL